MQLALEWLAANPLLLLFVLILAAAALSRVRLGGLAFDACASALVVGALVAAIASACGVRLGIEGAVRSIAGWAFLYVLGLRVGPSLAQAFRAPGGRCTAVAVAAGLLGLAGAVAFARLWVLPPGSAAGLVAGAMTSPAALVSAEEAMRDGLHLLPGSHLFEEVSGMMALAFAFAYVWGVAATFGVCRYLPRALGLDLVSAARPREDEDRLQLAGDPGLVGLRPLEVRAHRVANEALSGRSVRDLRERYPRLTVLEVLRTEPASREPDTTVERFGASREARESLYAKLGTGDGVTLRQGDVLTLGAEAGDLAESAADIGPEVFDASALQVPLDHAQVVVTRPSLAGRTLEAMRVGGFAGEVAVQHIERAGIPLAVGSRTRLERGDVLHVVGLRGAVERFVAHAGSRVQPRASVEVLVLSAGMVLGVLAGSAGFHVAGSPIAFGYAGGLLGAGILVSWLLSRSALAGQAPTACRAPLEELALAAFAAIVGLEAGGYFMASGSGELATQLAVAGFFIACVPLLVAWAIGHHLLGIKPAVLVGCIAGARGQWGPAEDASRRAGSPLPGSGFPVSFAVATVLAAILGPLAMRLA